MKKRLITRVSQIKDLIDINESRIDIWLLDLNNICDEEREASFQLLDKEERRRASNFHFVADKNRFILCRGLSRIILSTYCCEAPNIIQMAYGECGKPYLADFDFINFNISHTHNWGVMCVSRETIVGVDIEYIDETIMLEDVVSIFSSEEEHDWVYEGNIKERFFTLFTCKEAFLKAQGTGFLRENIPSIKYLGNKGLSLNLFHYENWKIYSAVWNKEYIISICFSFPI